MITLRLTTLRDLLFNFPDTAELNAAKAHEARQPWADYDRKHMARIVPAHIARAIDEAEKQMLATNPDYVRAFYIQIKTLPPEAKDQWVLSAEYGVLWPAAQWPQSLEYRFECAERQRSVRAAHEIEQRNATRYERMIAKFVHVVAHGKAPSPHLQRIADNLLLVLQGTTLETEVFSIIDQLQRPLGITIYELPSRHQEGVSQV